MTRRFGGRCIDQVLHLQVLEHPAPQGVVARSGEQPLTREVDQTSSETAESIDLKPLAPGQRRDLFQLRHATDDLRGFLEDALGGYWRAVLGLAGRLGRLGRLGPQEQDVCLGRLPTDLGVGSRGLRLNQAR